MTAVTIMLQNGNYVTQNTKYTHRQREEKCQSFILQKEKYECQFSGNFKTARQPLR